MKPIYTLAVLIALTACSKKDNKAAQQPLTVQNYRMTDSNYYTYDANGAVLLQGNRGNDTTILRLSIDATAKKAYYASDTFIVTSDTFRCVSSNFIPYCISQTITFPKDSIIITRKLNGIWPDPIVTLIVRGYILNPL